MNILKQIFTQHCTQLTQGTIIGGLLGVGYLFMESAFVTPTVTQTPFFNANWVFLALREEIFMDMCQLGTLIQLNSGEIFAQKYIKQLGYYMNLLLGIEILASNPQSKIQANINLVSFRCQQTICKLLKVINEGNFRTPQLQEELKVSCETMQENVMNTFHNISQSMSLALLV